MGWGNSSGTSGYIDINGNMFTYGAMTANTYMSSPTVKTTVVYTTTYTISNADFGTMIYCANATTTQTITFPAGLTSYGRVLIFRGTSANVNISNGAGCTAYSRTGNFNVLNQWGVNSLWCLGGTAVIVDGNI